MCGDYIAISEIHQWTTSRSGAIELTEDLNETLQNIKMIIGVENVVLIQKDGYPVASAGVWFSKEEVFAVASSTCAIFGVAKLIHGDFKYLLMESETSKVFLASLPNNPNYFLTITTAPRVNLAALFIEMRDSMAHISYILRQHIEGRLPPLRSGTDHDPGRAQQCNHHHYVRTGTNGFQPVADRPRRGYDGHLFYRRTDRHPAAAIACQTGKRTDLIMTFRYEHV